MATFTTAKGTELPILDLKGKPYLQVAHRILWFREEKPDWTINTSIITTTDKLSIFKAEILDEQGRLRATAHKSETPQGFGDHLEKAETGAIGRALALVGYGTQFTGDEFDEKERLADSPTARATKPAQAGNFLGAVVPWGKFAGQPISSLNHTQIMQDIQFCEKVMAEKGANASKNVTQYHADLVAYINQDANDSDFPG